MLQDSGDVEYTIQLWWPVIKPQIDTGRGRAAVHEQ